MHYTDLQYQQQEQQAINDSWQQFECEEVPHCLMFRGNVLTTELLTRAEAEKHNKNFAATGTKAEYVEKKKEEAI